MPSKRTPEWLDAQFNNRARVPQAPQILARWAQASARARSETPCVLDLPYGLDPSERLDVFPAPVAGSPVLVFIHGGWWRALDKSDHSFVAPSFQADGVTVVVPNYALAPAVDIGHITMQMVRALAWTWRHISAWGGDRGRIAVAGHSAGGHLAAMMLSCRWAQFDAALPAGLVRGALGISGVYDLEPLRRSPYLQRDLRLTPASVRRLSPALFAPPAGRFHAVAGADESEEHLRQNRLIRDAWGPRSVPVCGTLPGHNHFTVLDSLAEGAGRLHGLALQLPGRRRVKTPDRVRVHAAPR